MMGYDHKELLFLTTLLLQVRGDGGEGGVRARVEVKCAQWCPCMHAHASVHQEGKRGHAGCAHQVAAQPCMSGAQRRVDRLCTSGGQTRLCRGGEGPRVNGAGKPCMPGGRAQMELESGPYEAGESTILDDEAPARHYLRDPLSPTTKMGL